jgi:hypothetical protein
VVLGCSLSLTTNIHWLMLALTIFWKASYPGAKFIP